MSLTPRKRFLCCIPVEGAATALGYFQASIAVAGILIVLREIVMTFYRFVRFSSDYDNYTSYHLTLIKDLSLVLLVLGLCLTLAVFLLVGIKKRRPGYVLTYLVFSELGVLALAVYWLIIVYTESYYVFYEGGVEIFLLMVVYSLFLVMVDFVYRNIKLEKNCNSMIYNTLQEDNYIVKDVKEKNLA